MSKAAPDFIVELIFYSGKAGVEHLRNSKLNTIKKSATPWHNLQIFALNAIELQDKVRTVGFAWGLKAGLVIA